MNEYVEMTSQGVRRIAAADLLDADWDLPRAGEEGYRRAIGRGVMGAGASLGIGIMPPAQRSPLHETDAEHLLLGLAGELHWRVEGTEYTTGPMDLLFIGAGLQYEYWNPTDEIARFVDVIGRVDAWPFSAHYADG